MPEALRHARAQQQTKDWNTDYALRAGAEGTIRQTAAVTGLHHARYRGLVPRKATFAPSRRPARSPTALGAWEVPPLAAPAESPSTSRTRTSGRHAESTLLQALGCARAGGTPMTPLLDGPTLPAAALAKTHLEHLYSAVALNLIRLDAGGTATHSTAPEPPTSPASNSASPPNQPQ